MVQVRQGSKGEGRSVQLVSAFVIRLSPYLALIVAVSAFLSISLHQLALPGLYYDEALDLVPMLQVMHGEPATLLRGIGFSLGNYTYPLMLLDYMGSLNGYLSLPFMALFGPGVVAARVAPIFFSAVTIVLAFGLARAWFGHGVAAVTALLLAVNPSFIWFSRQGISVTSVMTVFSLGSLLLLDQWRRREKRDLRFENGDSSIVNRQSSIPNLQSPFSNLLLIAAGLLLGLGLWAKLIFLWWIVALGAMALVWLLTSQGHIGRKFVQMVRPALWVLLGLLIGAAPLIYYNLYDLLRQPFDLRNAYTLGLLFKSLGQTTDYGVNNLDFWTNLQKAITDFNVFIDGSYFWYNGVPYSNVYAVPTFVIAVIVGSVLAFVRREWHKWLALLAAIAVTVLISAFTVSGLWATHLFIMLPLPQMVVAVAAVWLACEPGRRGAAQSTAPQEQVGAGFTPATSTLAISNPQSPISRSPSLHLTPAPWLPRALAPLLVIILLALPVWRDLWVSEQHHATLTRTGGSGRFSDAVYKLATHLDTEHIDAPIALDWGIEKSVRVLTDDRVRPKEVFGFSAQPDNTFNQQVRELLRDPSRQYIVLWDRFAVYNRRQAFTQIANSMGMQVTETFIAHEQSGLPVYVMLQAK
jgi:uncharacterized membrane protein